MATLLKMTKKVTTKIELSKAIIYIALCFRNIKLSDTEISVLAYFMVYGVNQQSKQLIVNSGICKNIQGIKTIMVKLKKKELIFKDDFDGRVCVNKSLNLKLTNTFTILLKIDTDP